MILCVYDTIYDERMETNILRVHKLSNIMDILVSFIVF